MNTIEKVKRRIEEQLPVEPAPNQAALEEAERLSDLFSNVKVVPYRVPAHSSFYDEKMLPLEYDVHTLWATTLGLKQAIRDATQEEFDACRDELIEAAKMILAECGAKQ